MLLFISLSSISLEIYGVWDFGVLHHMFEGEKLIIFVAKVSHSIVDGSAVGRCCRHHFCHYSGDVQLFLSLYNVSRLSISCPLQPR
jgi:hypothetical protein